MLHNNWYEIFQEQAIYMMLCRLHLPPTLTIPLLITLKTKISSSLHHYQLAHVMSSVFITWLRGNRSYTEARQMML